MGDWVGNVFGLKGCWNERICLWECVVKSFMGTEDIVILLFRDVSGNLRLGKFNVFT